MRQDALARRNEPDPQPAAGVTVGAPMTAEYDALCAALSASARGRAFLDEHARRARLADTTLAIDALTRLEVLLRQRDEEADAKARLRSDLRAMLGAVVSARASFNKFEGVLAKRETVMALFDMLEQRITEMLADAPAEHERPANENAAVATIAPVEAAPVAAAAPAQPAVRPPDEPTRDPKPAAPPRQVDIIARINALTPAEKIALFS